MKHNKASPIRIHLPDRGLKTLRHLMADCPGFSRDNPNWFHLPAVTRRNCADHSQNNGAGDTKRAPHSM